MGYHNVEIKKGVYGEWSKVEEEIDEILDSLDQQLKPMLIIELCDCLGALKAFFILGETNEFLILGAFVTYVAFAITK